MGRRRSQRRSSALAALTGLLVAAAVIGGALVWVVSRKPAPPQACAVVGSGATPYTLDLDQAANATTIAGVGKRLGMPDHAITVALAAALQESKLHDLTYGDRDSVGLFQQRPSQGWGPRNELLQPGYAAAVFYQHLQRVSGWQDLAVTAAAQAVQRSAAPDAYARWEAEARALAIALTGEVAAGMTCRFDPARPAISAAPPATEATMAQAMADQLGAPAAGVPVPAARGWLVASWAVGHAARYGITGVSFAGRRWTPRSGVWVGDAAAGGAVNIG